MGGIEIYPPFLLFFDRIGGPAVANPYIIKRYKQY